MSGVFRAYFLFVSFFNGTLHIDGKSDDRGKTLSISSLFIRSMFGRVLNK